MFSASISESIFWIAAAICAIAQVAVIRAALAGRTPGASSSAVAQAREFFWVLLPAAFLILLLTWSSQSLPGRFLDVGAQRPGTVAERPALTVKT